MYLSFEINTQEGDKVLVSLCSSYPYLQDILTPGAPSFDLLEVCIVREKGTGPIRMEVFGKIAELLISVAEENPASVLFYFCDFSEDIPHQRRRDMPSHEYRNTLFKLLFQRYES